MGITYKGWRKYLVILGFIGPTLLGILLISVFPIIFNVYVSFTNRNTFHYPVYELPEADKAAFIESHPVLGRFAWNVVCPIFPGFRSILSLTSRLRLMWIGLSGRRLIPAKYFITPSK